MVQRLRYLGDQLAEIAARDSHLEDIAKKLADRRERGVTHALHIGDQRRQLGPEEPAVSYLRRKRRVVNLLAGLTPIGQPSMFVDANRLLDKLDLLDRFRRFVTWQQRTPTGGSDAEGVFPHVVEHLGRKFRTLASWMSRLSALLPLSTSPFAFGCLLVRVDDITRRRFRGGRRILFRLGQLFLERCDLLFEQRNTCPQIGDLSRQGFAVRACSCFCPHGHTT